MCHHLKPCAHVNEDRVVEEFLTRDDEMYPYVREMIATAQGDNLIHDLNLSGVGADIRTRYGLWDRHGDEAMIVSRRILKEVCRRLR